MLIFSSSTFVECVNCQNRTDDYSLDSLAISAWNARAADDWVSVKDELPGPGRSVWVYHTTGSIAKAKRETRSVLPGYGWVDQGNGIVRAAAFVTHWRPLPEPPELSREAEDKCRCNTVCPGNPSIGLVATLDDWKFCPWCGRELE